MKKLCNTCGETKEANKTKSSGFTVKRNGYKSSCKTCRNRHNRLKYKRRKRDEKVRETEAIEADPEKYFIGRICWRAGLDKDMKFLNSEWFDELCDLASFEPDSMRKLCRKVSIRN